MRLQVDPSYVPKVVVKGITWNSISLGWDSPPLDKMPNIRDYITYYKITRETSLEEVKPTLWNFFFISFLFVISSVASASFLIGQSKKEKL